MNLKGDSFECYHDRRLWNFPGVARFEAATVADLAESVETVRWATQGPQLAAIADINREEGEL